MTEAWPYVTTRKGTVHLIGCRRLRKATGWWPWKPRNDGPGVAQACSGCLGGALPADVGCRITVWPPTADPAHTFESRACGVPAVRDGLCARHLADRVRLGGAP